MSGGGPYPWGNPQRELEEERDRQEQHKEERARQERARQEQHDKEERARQEQHDKEERARQERARQEQHDKEERARQERARQEQHDKEERARQSQRDKEERARQSQRDKEEIARQSQLLSLRHTEYAREQHLHHDYSNIPAARRDHNRQTSQRNDTSLFPAVSGNGEANRPSNNSNGTVISEEGPSSPLARVEAPVFQTRERRGGGGDGGEHHTSRNPPASSTFRRKRAELAQQGQLFEDREFPPGPSSLYYSRQQTSPVKWMRPARICAPDRPVFAHGGFSRFDVKQGALGDCWFVAAMACLCGPDHQQLLERVIPDKDHQSFQDHYAGIFCFRFWHFGEWREVLVDDCLPTRGGALTFIHSTHRQEFWPALMEKAYAKLYGSYEALKGGIMADSLTDLTGGVAESFTLRGDRANVPRNVISILFKAFARGALIGCGINGADGEALRETKLSNGLISGHAYSVTALRQVRLQAGDRILIRVRNPHGSKTEWRGPWSDGSQEWQQVPPSTREQLGLVRRSDGEFWMDFEDFMDNFDSLVMCNLTPDAPVSTSRRWHTAQHHGRWVKHFNAGGRPSLQDCHWANPQYVLKLQDTDDDDDSTCSVIVQLMQKDRRRLKQKGEVYRYIGFIIYQVPSGCSLPVNREFFHHNSAYAKCDSFINTRQIVKRFALPPGVYVVVPCTYEKDMEADFFIRFFFEKGQVSEYADEPPEKVEVPPPTPSPKHREQEEKFQKFFYEMSGEDMEINCFELHEAVNHALKKEPLHREIGLDACRSFISLMDVDNSGRLGFTEFLYLWSMLRTWKILQEINYSSMVALSVGVGIGYWEGKGLYCWSYNIDKTFLQHDADNSGKMDALELRTALASNGYKVSNQMMSAAIFRYADHRGTLSLDNFLILMAKLMNVFNVYQKHLKKDAAVFTLQQWVEEALRL